MMGIIVAGHGNYASGITSMLNLVVGEQQNYETIDFVQGEPQEDLEEEFADRLKKLEACERIAVLTDIAGGSPFKTAVTLALEDERLDVISGTNVPMLVELIFGRMGPLEDERLIGNALEAGRRQIQRFHRGMEGMGQG